MAGKISDAITSIIAGNRLAGAIEVVRDETVAVPVLGQLRLKWACETAKSQRPGRAAREKNAGSTEKAEQAIQAALIDRTHHLVTAVRVDCAPWIDSAGRSLVEPLPVTPESELTCGPCSGRGKVTCKTCNGQGEQRCDVCTGSGWLAHPPCRGTGRVACTFCGGSGLQAVVPLTDEQRASGVATAPRDACPHCFGNKTIACVCEGGRVSCTSCSGTGVKRCAACGGTRQTACAGCSGTGVVTEARTAKITITPTFSMTLGDTAHSLARKLAEANGANAKTATEWERRPANERPEEGGYRFEVPGQCRIETLSLRLLDGTQVEVAGLPDGTVLASGPIDQACGPIKALLETHATTHEIKLEQWARDYPLIGWLSARSTGARFDAQQNRLYEALLSPQFLATGEAAVSAQLGLVKRGFATRAWAVSLTLAAAAGLVIGSGLFGSLGGGWTRGLAAVGIAALILGITPFVVNAMARSSMRRRIGGE